MADPRHELGPRGGGMEENVVVLGAGNMGGALVAGMVGSGLLGPERITVVDVAPEALDRIGSLYSVRTSSALHDIHVRIDVVILAVKPQVWPDVAAGWSLEKGADPMVLSIMAGIASRDIESALGGEPPVVRAMPNILAQVRAAASALCPGRFADASHIQTAEEILGSVGETVVVDEWQMDAVTGLSGAGPGYVFAMIDALADGGVKMGLPKSTSLKLAAQTFLGAAKMLLDTDEHPAALRDRVTSPGGATIAGLFAMEQAGFRAALMAAVEAAARRSGELGA